MSKDMISQTAALKGREAVVALVLEVEGHAFWELDGAGCCFEDWRCYRSGGRLGIPLQPEHLLPGQLFGLRAQVESVLVELISRTSGPCLGDPGGPRAKREDDAGRSVVALQLGRDATAKVEDS
ncbi:hypothetical protein Q4543_02220 [Salipiger sp. 1_MG-2023]|nr:hypothetical protein [Salipiger sp. 1_MG-2023]MDO6584322.1 hypothetical protein [Salipiger sp. 1_MG-2023]